MVAKANQYARDHGLRQFVVYQGLWNAAVRDFERDIIPMCKDEGMAIIPYGVLGAGKFQTSAGYKEREVQNPGRRGDVSVLYKTVAKQLETLANTKNATITSIAAAYVLHKAPYVFPLIGCRTLEHVKGTVNALDVRLSQQEIEEIEAVHSFDPGFPHNFLSGSLFGGEPKVPSGPQDVWLTNVLGVFDYVEAPKAIQLVEHLLKSESAI